MASDSQGFEAFFIGANPGQIAGQTFLVPKFPQRQSRPHRNRRVVNPVTLLSCNAIIVITPNQQGSIFMLFLTAILRVWLPPEPEPNDLLARTRLRLGHLGLTVIALVFILVTFWQR
jgi:hypothetical protein